MSDPQRRDEHFVAWESADHPDGPVPASHDFLFPVHVLGALFRGKPVQFALSTTVLPESLSTALVSA